MIDGAVTNYPHILIDIIQTVYGAFTANSLLVILPNLLFLGLQNDFNILFKRTYSATRGRSNRESQ